MTNLERQNAALRACAKYVRDNLNVIGTRGPKMLTQEERVQCQQRLKTKADQFDSLAEAAEKGTAKYEQFDAIRVELQEAGGSLARELTSAVAKAFVSK